MEFASPDLIKELLIKYGTGYKNHDDPIFIEGNYLIQPFVRLGVFTSYEIDEELSNDITTCNVPNCNEKFTTISGYETHYNSFHRYICNICKKRCPSGHLLDLHLEETHDSFFAVRSEKKEMYSCYLQECTHKSWNSQDRKDHCIKIHNFPQNFRFDKQKKSKDTVKVTNTNLDITEDSMDVSDVTNKIVVAAPKTMRNFNFGHQKVKTFAMEPNCNKKKKDGNKSGSKILEDNRMVQDLMDNLPD